MKYCPLCGKNYGDEREFCEVDGATLRISGKKDPYIGNVIKGRYQVLSKLGEGGMGAVYLAEQVSVGRKVAIKILLGNYASDDAFISRFRREARLAASLNHRNIVTVYDFDQASDGTLFIVMEYLSGQKLSDVIRRDGPLEIGRATRLGLQIAAGLDAAHRAGVIHRDIKPDNIMVAGADASGEIKLMDFGIAQLRDPGNASRITRPGLFVGTPAYMAPEQVDGGEVSDKTDIYALGVVLYEMLSGSVPFTAATPGAVLIKHIQEMPVPLRKLRRELPATVERAVMQALEKNPGKRQPNMHAVLQNLKEIYASEVVNKTSKTVQARKIDESQPPEVQKWLIKNDLWTALVVIPSGLLLAFLIFFLIGSLGKLSWEPLPIQSLISLLTQKAVWLLLLAGGAAILVWGYREIRKRDRTQRKSDPDRVNNDYVNSAASDSTIVDQIPPNMPQESKTSLRENSPVVSPDVTSVFQNLQVLEPSQIPKVALTIIRCADSSLVGKKITLNQFPFSVGRANTDLTIANDLLLSRQHVMIDYHPGEFTIRDLETTNGSYVNGVRLSSNREQTLLFGATVQLSNATTLAFILDEWDEPKDLSGTVLNDRYQLTHQLYISSKAGVYAAKDRECPELELAIKVLSPKLNQYSGYSNQFSREAKTAASLQHPHICKVIGYGQADVQWSNNESVRASYLCMALMEGGDLTTRLKENYQPPLNRVIEWARKLGDALDYAHRQGVIHSGIKLSCVVFDNEENPYLTDFAVASKSGDISRSLVLGAPAFLAPEQWDGLEPTEATDQYSFAVLLYLLVTGSRPYEGQENPDIRKRNFVQGAIPAHEQASQNGRNRVPSRISRVLARALATNHQDRYPSIIEFVREFELALISPNEQANIFLSYKRGLSAGWASLFSKELQANHSFSVFVDTEKQDSAIRFPDRLRQEIERCDVFVCFLADETLESNWVMEEIRIAHENHKPMIPVFQESYRRLLTSERPTPHIEALLEYEGVHLFDDRNIYVDQAIEAVAQIVKKTIASDVKILRKHG